MALEKLTPIDRTEGETVYRLHADEASSDPIRAARLAKAAANGDEKAKEKLERMKKTSMYREE